MENKYQNEERYYNAQKKVEEIKSFYIHLTVYVLSNLIVMVVNLLTSPEFLYFLFCVFGWGFAIVLHGMTVFNYIPFVSKDWEEQKIKEFMDEEKTKNNNWE